MNLQNKKGNMLVFLFCVFIAIGWKVFPQFFSPKNTVHHQYNLVPILCLHDIDGPGPYALTRHEFRYYLESIKKSGVQVVSLKKLLQHAKSKTLFNKPSLAITIDDNYKNIVRVAAPLLREYDFPATFFVYTNSISKNPRNGLSWSDLNRLQNEGFEIQNHSHTHTAFHKARAGESKKEYRKRVYREITMSKNILEKNINNLKIYAFAYPMGFRSKSLHNAIFSDGYSLTLTTDAKPVDLSKKFNGVFHRYTIQKKLVKNPEKMFRLQLQHANRIYKSTDKSSLSHSMK